MKHVIVRKNEYNGNNCYIKNLDGLKIKPRNQFKDDEMSVDSMLLINPSFIEKVLKRKIKHKLDHYINYIISLLNDDSDESPERLHIALDDVAHYKSVIEYKYRKYLDDKYINLLLKKINILEHELKMKTAYIMENEKVEEDIVEEKKGKSR